jgi:hypothetical protein
MSIYYGETYCQKKKRSGDPCKFYAYFQVGTNYFCGVHSNKNINERIKLPVNPNKKKQKNDLLVSRQDDVVKTADENKKNSTRGTIVCYKMKMMKDVECRPGFYNIFPNFNHGNRKDGFGCPSLSPKSMGPINHGQKGLPPAKNLENFHQGNKVFPSEVDEKGNPLPLFYKTQLEMYNDKIPHRHKEASKKNNVPLYSIWIEADGKEKRMSYRDSRQFYCTFYEREALKSPEFKKLQTLIEYGFNLQICGYDAYDVSNDIEVHYLDITRPFGHELCLYVMLTTDAENYPWKKYKTEDF